MKIDVYGYTGKLIGTADGEALIRLRRGQNPAKLAGWKRLDWSDLVRRTLASGRVKLPQNALADWLADKSP